MREREWVKSLIPRIAERLVACDESLTISDHFRLPYADEVLRYSENEPCRRNTRRYEVDLLVREQLPNGGWKPRVIIEVKLARITTHGAIAYSQKASTHKKVHPYLRYGILLSDRKHYPLPGRLFRHGAHFDFMISWQGLDPSADELDALIHLIMDEVRGSRDLEEIVFNSRSPDREAYTLLHRPLLLDQVSEGDGGS